MKFTQPFAAKLTPFEEVSALQLAAFRRHKRNGTSPGNPKWYRSTVIKPFKPQLSVLLPKIESGADWHTKNGNSRPDPFEAVHAGMDTATYVRLFEQAANLKGQIDFAAMRERRLVADKVVAKRRNRQTVEA